MNATLPLPLRGAESSFDQRWTHWQEAGAAQRRTWDGRACAAAVLAAVGVATWLVIALYLG